MRIALIDHSYHQTTKSTQFFSKILEDVGTVHRFYDETWCRGKNKWRQNFNEFDYDLIVVWQTHEAFSALSGKHDNVVFAPMYDGMLIDNGFYWKEEFGKAKCISFSRKLHEEVKLRGAISQYYKYFPDPAQFETVSDLADIRAFFWYRSQKVPASKIFDMCKNFHLAKFTLHNAPDPGNKPLQIRRVPVNISDFEVSYWFEDRDAYLRSLLNHNLYFASRPFEGIGMGFLEAMASALCVVAPDAPTMNEYIASAKNGILYIPEKRVPFELTHIREIGLRARETVEQGFKDWQRALPELINFIVTPIDHLRAKKDGPFQ